MRIAIFGGTFDPIHNGHLAAAESVADLFRVDEFHFVPSFSPPHKPARRITSPFHRLAMVALATAPYACFRVSTLELDTLQLQYTVVTLAEMRRLYPGAELLFVLGTDMYAEIETWKDYRELFRLAHLVAINRPGFAFRQEVSAYRTVNAGEVAALPTARTVFHVPFVEQPISSTRIRGGWETAAEIRQLVPPAVRGYIEKQRLYAAANA